MNRTVSIIGELRNSLDLKAGGQLAANLGELYDYMGRRLLKATAENRVEMLDEVSKLLHDIRAAWVAIPARRAANERSDRRQRHGCDVQARAAGHVRPMAGSAEDVQERRDLLDSIPRALARRTRNGCARCARR